MLQEKRLRVLHETREHALQISNETISSDPEQRIFAVSMGRTSKDMKALRFVNRDKLQKFKNSTAQLLLSIMLPRDFDPAFAHAVDHCRFVPYYWKPKLPKNTRLLCQKEWNDAVDEYITLPCAEGDMRTTREIEEGAKIGVDGASLYKACSRCNTKEEREGEFAVCSRCKVRAYCGKDCQQLHWKEGHKAKCGTEFDNREWCPLHLPSQNEFHIQVKADYEKYLSKAGGVSH